MPDLPGYVAAGDTLQEVKDLIREAIAFHIAGLRDDGLPIPEPSTYVFNIDVKDEGV